MKIKKYFKILLLIFFISPIFCFASWKLKTSYEGVSIYTSPHKTRLILRSDTPQKGEKITKKSIKESAATKRKILAQIGITKWEVSKSSVKKDKKRGVTRVELHGSYRDSSNKPVYFVEHQFYSSTKQLQLLLTNSKKDSLKKDAKLQNLEEFQKKYGLLKSPKKERK